MADAFSVFLGLVCLGVVLGVTGAVFRAVYMGFVRAWLWLTGRPQLLIEKNRYIVARSVAERFCQAVNSPSAVASVTSYIEQAISAYVASIDETTRLAIEAGRCGVVTPVETEATASPIAGELVAAS